MFKALHSYIANTFILYPFIYLFADCHLTLFISFIHLTNVWFIAEDGMYILHLKHLEQKAGANMLLAWLTFNKIFVFLHRPNKNYFKNILKLNQ